MSKIVQFGEQVEGYDIPVLNEREIRAAAGLLFLMVFTSVMTIVLTENFTLLKYAVTIFLTDMIIRVFINPRYAPTLIIGRWIVRNQNPEYVGAQQKKFAWIIGVILGAIFFMLSVVVNSYSPITGIICLICLVFLFFEAAFGICLGCWFYSLMYKEKAQYCPGEICEPKDRQEIQKLGFTHLLIVVGFVAYVWATAVMFGDFFREKPYDLLGIDDRPQSQQNM